MQRFCIDYQPAVAQGAGIGRYVREIAKGMLLLLTGEERLRLFFCDFHRRASQITLPGAEIRSFRLVPGAIMQKAWTKFGFPAFDRFSGAADLFHFPNFLARPVRHGKIAITIHDMSFERFPQFAEARNLRYLRAGIEKSVGVADLVLTDSEFSRREIEELVPDARGKTKAVLLGISGSFAPEGEDAQRKVRETLGLQRPFVLTVGTVEPRKNLEFLVDVFERLAPSGYDLVVAGAPGWRCESIFRRFENTRFKDNFHYVRFVPDGMLSALYSAASLFAVTSFYEGFGFPPLEAMACGTPVVSSSGGSLPEVLGDAASIMPDFDADAWAHEALRLLKDDALRAERRRAGIAKAASYRWENTARETLAAYREVLST